MTRELLTMRELDKLGDYLSSGWSLDDWYCSVRDTPLKDLAREDLAKAIRQGLFLDEIVPWALERLYEDPFSGEYYDGELAESLGYVPSTFWSTHTGLRDRLAMVLSKVDQGWPDEEFSMNEDFLMQVEQIRRNAGLV